MANGSFPRAIVGAAVGAGLMYFFDPVRGRRRRARLRDLAIHARRVERELLTKASRDAAHRARGLAERVRHAMNDDAPDGVVEARVRAQIGRVASHPSAIEVQAVRGRLSLRGAVLASEAAAVVRCVERVPGVRVLIDQLDHHERAGAAPRARVLSPRDEWSPALQVGAMAAGSALAGWGAAIRGGAIGTLAATAGGALFARAAINMPLARMLGLDRSRYTVDLQKTITIDAPIEDVFALWSRLEQFPRFMQHVREVRPLDADRRRWRWIVDGPFAAPLAFDADLTRLEPPRMIAWQTAPNQALDHAGLVQFEDVGGGRTRLHVQLHYRPLLGLIGHAFARALGFDPKRRMNDDLNRVKALLEQGETRAHHERVSIDELELH